MSEPVPDIVAELRLHPCEPAGRLSSITLPIADDWAGNLYLLVCAGPSAGEVLWWDHERDQGDTDAEHVADSFIEFTELLAYEEES